MMKTDINKIIRIITVAPIMALALLTALYFGCDQMFRGIGDYLIAILFLTVLPIMAYPLQPFIPPFDKQGRKGQRNLAIIMAVVGYIGGIIVALLTKAPKSLLAVYLTYLFSGIFIVIFNKLIKVKASGHACGTVGPIACATRFIGPWALICLPVVALVYYSSIKMGRHKLTELIVGSILPIAALLWALLVTGLL